MGPDAPIVVSVVFLVIVAPITEELFFRGVLQRSLTIRYGPRVGIILSGVLFGLVHGLPWQILPALLLGLLFAWWTERTQSLWPALVGHAANNALSFALTRMNPDRVVLNPDWPEPAVLAGGAVLLVLGLGLAGPLLRAKPSETIVERSYP